MKIQLYLIILLIILQKAQVSLSKCSSGQFQNQNNICEQCDSQCATCQYFSSNCIECKGENQIYIDNKCQCLEGFYQNTQQECKQCQKCQPGHFTSKNSKCIINPNKECDGICSLKCQECQNNSSNCTVCKNRKNGLNNPPFCGCESGFHDNEGQLLECIECKENCLECKNSNVCLTCRPGYFLDSNKSCVKCLQYKKNQCIQQCPENTIQVDNKCIDINNKEDMIMYVVVICSSLFVLASVIVVFCILRKLKRDKKLIEIQIQQDHLDIEKQQQKLAQQKLQVKQAINSHKKQAKKFIQQYSTTITNIESIASPLDIQSDVIESVLQVLPTDLNREATYNMYISKTGSTLSQSKTSQISKKSNFSQKKKFVVSDLDYSEEEEQKQQYNKFNITKRLSNFKKQFKLQNDQINQLKEKRKTQRQINNQKPNQQQQEQELQLQLEVLGVSEEEICQQQQPQQDNSNNNNLNSHLFLSQYL